MLKKLFYTILAAATFSGCYTDYAVVYSKGGDATTETVYVYEEVEVPVYIETEVPEDPGLIWVDSFTQPQSVDGVDILWVIDTSGSMNRYDPQLMAGIEAMMNALPAAGWRLAMMSNDPDEAAAEAQFPLVPGDDIADAMDMYAAMGRGHREEGFDAVYEYIVNNPYAQTWMRHDAALLVVMVSDEEEQSDDHFPVLDDFITWYGNQRNGSAFLASINNVAQTESVCDLPPSVIDVGDRYMDATNWFGGTIVDICSEDWSPGVTDASNQLEPYESITLTHEAIADSIRVFVNGSLYHDWTYVSSDNTVYFTVIPESSALVEVGYRYYGEEQDTGMDTGP